MFETVWSLDQLLLKRDFLQYLDSVRIFVLYTRELRGSNLNSEGVLSLSKFFVLVFFERVYNFGLMHTLW